MKRLSLVLSLIVGIVLAATGCAPKYGTSTQPVQAPPNVSSAKPAPVTTVASPEDIAWANVVRAAQKEGKVNVYSYSMTGDVGLAVSRNFEQTYGIKLDIITGGGAALAERINTEKRMGTLVADFMDANTFQLGLLKDAGATASSEDIPVLREKGVWRVDPWVNDPQKNILVHMLLYNANIINTNLVKAGEEPKSLKDLAQTKWKGKLVQFDPKMSSSLSTYFLTMLQRNLVDEQTLLEIGKNMSFTSTDDEASRSVIQGTYAMRPGTSPMAVSRQMVQEPSLPVKIGDISEGVVVSLNALTAINGGPHPNAAKVLVNWLMSREGQTIFIGPQGSTPVRSDVPDFLPAPLRLTPGRIIVPTIVEERQNLQFFKDGRLAKLWGR